MATKHKHTWPGQIKCAEIGEGVCITEVTDGFLIGFDNTIDPDRRRIVGRVPTSGDHRVKWDQQGTLKGGDLTLSPSVLLDYGNGISFHGWVRAGKWVRA